MPCDGFTAPTTAQPEPEPPSSNTELPDWDDQPYYVIEDEASTTLRVVLLRLAMAPGRPKTLN